MNAMLFAYYAVWGLCIAAGIAAIVDIIRYWIDRS